MTGEKKIVGLWRDSAANGDKDGQMAEPEAASAAPVEAEAPSTVAARAERDWLEDAFAEKVLARLGLEPRVVWAVMITLFLSMLPLHADGPERQTAFVANALRLHRRYFGGA